MGHFEFVLWWINEKNDILDRFGEEILWQRLVVSRHRFHSIRTDGGNFWAINFRRPKGNWSFLFFLKLTFPLFFSSQPLYRYGGPIAMRKSHFSLGVIFKISFLKTKITTSAVPGIPRANPEHLRPIFERFASKTKNGKLYMTAEDFIRRLIKFLLFALFPEWYIEKGRIIEKMLIFNKFQVSRPLHGRELQ